MACMSPVRCRFSRSMGTTWLYPPPAAPPLIPNVGPIDGWRMATVAGRPMCDSAWPRPTVVVVLPSPRGVGVIADTTTYLAFGRPASSSIASSLIFATSCPYGSSRCAPMPILAAISGIGSSFARRAISRSLGNVTATPLPPNALTQSRQHLLAPLLGRLDLIEREHMDAGHLHLRPGQLRHQTRSEALRRVTARLDHAHEPVRVAAQESRRVGDPDARRHAQQLRRVRDTGHPDEDRQRHPALAHARDPPLHDAHVETEVADDVGRLAALVPHRLDREVVVDEAVAFRVAGHADLLHRGRVAR